MDFTCLRSTIDTLSESSHNILLAVEVIFKISFGISVDIKIPKNDSGFFSESLQDLYLECDYSNTRKYPLRGYILGVLTHTTASSKRTSASPRQ